MMNAPKGALHELRMERLSPSLRLMNLKGYVSAKDYVAQNP